MIVTDKKWYNKSGELRVGYGLENYLVENMAGIPAFLKKGWDVVGIISGHGNVRTGKCQIKGDKVLMSNGFWKKIEDVVVGDEVVSPQEDGGFKYVKVKDIHSRFEKEVFVVKENKNGKVLYSCAGNHIIPVYRPQSKRYKDKEGKEKRKTWKVLDLYDAKHISMLDTKRGKITSFSTSAIDFKGKKESSIEPYSLGVYLGDGSFSVRKIKSEPKKEVYFVEGHYRVMESGKKVWQEGHYCKNGHKHYKGFRINRQLNITSADEEIIEEVSKYYSVQKIYLKEGNEAKSFRFSTIGKLAKELVRLKLDGKGSGEKFIPQECLFSSIDYRLRLLAGLIDTDGTVGKNNHMSITTKSKQLSRDIKNLVFSLGGHSNITKVEGKCGDFVGEYCKVTISFKDPTIIPIKLKRKKDRLNIMKENPRNIGIECVKTNSQQVYGIEIEGDSKWYITNDWMITHNSTIAFQIAYFIAWLLAGGEMILKGNDKGKILSKPSRKVKFDLDNIVFTAEDLMERAHKLPRNSVIVYDEGRTGLDSKSAMMAVNRVMEDFFQECGQYGHVILIVLPNFFKLHEDYATARSIFLIDVYHDESFNRGYYSFFSKLQKEKLYFFGKKRIGTTAKYAATKADFYGRFSNWIPFDRQKYSMAKKKALDKKRLSTKDIRISKQRDILIYLYKNIVNLSSIELSDEIKEEFGVRMGKDIIKKACVNALNVKEKKSYIEET